MAPSGDTTVLVVDDDDAVRDVIVEALEIAGYRILQAADGQEALDRLRSIDDPSRLCLVLADVHMPVSMGPG